MLRANFTTSSFSYDLTTIYVTFVIINIITLVHVLVVIVIRFKIRFKITFNEQHATLFDAEYLRNDTR